LAKPMISIAMGVYNCQDTVSTAIESVLTQDFADFEFIICDDGSTDETWRVIQDHAARDSRIIFIQNQQNRGLPYTLNRCLALASGKYIARMDGDDVSLPGRFSRQVNFLERHRDYAVCGSAIQLFDGDGVWGKHIYPERPDRYSFLSGSPFANPSVMMRAHCVAEMSGYSEDPIVRQMEDADLFMRLYSAGYKGYNLPNVLLLYREDTDAVKRRTFTRALHATKASFRGYRSLGLLPIGMVWLLRPLLTSLVPSPLYQFLRKRRFGRD